jgi:hypothetical protein
MGIRDQSGTGAARCDICDKPCDAARQVKLSPDQLRGAADRGLDPFEECGAPLNAPGKSKEAHLRTWRKEVASRKAKWVVCPVCRLRMNDYLEPAPAATPEMRRPAEPREPPAPPTPRRPIKANEPESLGSDHEEPAATPRRNPKPPDKVNEPATFEREQPSERPSPSMPPRGLRRPDKVSEPVSFDYEEPATRERTWTSRRSPRPPAKVNGAESFDHEETVDRSEDGPGWQLNRGVVVGTLCAVALVVAVVVVMRSGGPREQTAHNPAAVPDLPAMSASPVKLKPGEAGSTIVTATRGKWLGDIELEGGNEDGVFLTTGTILTGESEATLAVRVANDARPGPRALLLNASVEGTRVSVPVAVMVEPKPLQVAVKPGSFSINAGETRSLEVTVWGQYQGVVTVDLDLPKGVRNRTAPLQGVMANGSCAFRVDLEADLDANAVPPRDVRVSATCPGAPPASGASVGGSGAGVPGVAAPGDVAPGRVTATPAGASPASTTFKFSLVRHLSLEWPTKPMSRTLVEGEKLLLPIELKREVAKGPIQLEVREGELPKGVKPSWARKTLPAGDSRATLELTAGDGVEDATKVVTLVATVEGKSFEFPIELMTHRVVLFNKTGHPGGATRVLFALEPARVISGGVDGTVLVREVEGERKFELKEHEDAISCLALSPSKSQLMSGGEKGGVCLWDLATGTLTRKLVGGKAAVLRLALTDETMPGETVQAAAAPAQVLVWLSKKGANLNRSFAAPTADYAAELRGGHTPGRPGSMEYLMFKSSKEIELRQLGTRGTDDKTFTGHTSEVTMARFSPDYSQVVSAGSDGTVRLWDVATAKGLRTFRGHKGSVLDAVFSPDGDRIASAGADGTVRVWRIPPPADR